MRFRPSLRIPAVIALAGAALCGEAARADCTWLQVAKILPSELQPFDHIGWSSDLKGTRAIFGAIGADDAGEMSGSAYIYERINQAWVKKARLTPFDGVADDKFGRTVAIDGNLAIVGSPFHTAVGTDAGAAYIYRYNGTSWLFEAKIIGPDTAAYDNFGISVAISGDTALIGARHRRYVIPEVTNIVGAGAAYVYKRNLNGTWSHQATLISDEPHLNARVGSAVTIEGDIAAVAGDNEFHPTAGPHCGAVHVFKRTGTVWTREGRLNNADPSSGDQFGNAIDISGERIVVSAPFDNQPTPVHGTISVFKRNSATATWSLEDRFWPNDPDYVGQIGYSIAIDGDAVIAGAPFDLGFAGRAHLFQRSGSEWIAAGFLVPSDSGGDDWFGHSMAMSAGRAVVGAIDDDDMGGNAGAVYSFNVSCTPPPPTCPADIVPAPAGDQVVNVNDLLQVISTWGTSGAGDIDGNNMVDVNDLLAVITAWGPCP